MSEQPVTWTGREAVGFDGSAWAPVPYNRNETTGEIHAFNGGQWVRVYEPGMVEGAGIAARNLITGRDRREADLPELRSAPIPQNPTRADADRSIGIMRGYLFSRDPQGVADIARGQGMETRTDRFGNPIVTQGGQDYFVNAPGVSGADATRVAADTVMFAPAARLMQGATAIGRLAGLGAGAAGGAATSIGQDVAAQAAGSRQPVDIGAAGITGAAMGVAGFAAPEIDRFVGWVANQARGGSTRLYDPASQQLTAEGRRIAQQAGLDPDAISGGLAQRFANLADNAADPRAAAALAETQTLPGGPVRITRGQVTGDPSQQMTENMMEKGVFGNVPQTIMRGAREQTQEDLARVGQAVQGRLAGGQPTVTELGQGGRRAQEALVGQADRARAGVDAAYDTARQTRGALDGDFARERFIGVRDAVSRDHALTGLPRTNAILDDLAGQLDRVPENGDVPVRALFDWRQRARAAQAAGGEEAVAIRKAVGEVDSILDDAITGALVRGDEASISAFRTAIQTNRDYASRFKGGDVIQRLTAREQRSGEWALSVPPDQAVNAIFGSRQLFGGGNVARDLGTLRTRLGPDSAEWNGLREEVFMRLLRAGQGPVDPAAGTQVFSGVKFLRALGSANRDYPDIMRTMFNGEERALLDQFGRVAARATGTVRGGDNFSNTTPAAANIMQRIMQASFMGEGAALRLASIPLVGSLYRMGVGLTAAPAALNPVLRAPVSAAPFAIGPGSNAAQSSP